MTEEIKAIILNATGLSYKLELIKFKAIKNSIDIWHISETWLKRPIFIE